MATDKHDLTVRDVESVRPQAYDTGINNDPQRGDWYWYQDNQDKEPWLGCVMDIGTNYLLIHGPEFNSGYKTARVHFDKLEKYLTPAPDAPAFMQDRISHFQSEIDRLLGRVREETARLGVVPTQDQIDNHSAEGTNALAVVSQQVDTNAYKKALITAKEETLPELFKQIEQASKQLTGWMKAPQLPVKAEMGKMKDGIKAIDDRIYTIELYAGLTEEAVLCGELGPVADIDEKLHVMQRRLYMDEECLLSYKGGGIEIRNIGEFDDWICEAENRDRVLPFPRCAVAFRVRRNEKEREDGGNVGAMHVNIQLAKADLYTYLYIRNGGKIWRIVCDFEFDEMVFPDSTIFDPSKPMMVKMFADRVEKMITVDAWEVMKAEGEEQERLYHEWSADNPGDNSWIRNPYHNSVGFRRDWEDWKPFDHTNVYYDEAMAKIEAEMKRYNRVAIIIQGLFDRSEVLHPHRPVQVWDPVSFANGVELVYDATTLTYGEKPDFLAYLAELNSTIDENTIVTGQEDYWLRQCAIRENQKRENDYNYRGNLPNYKRFRPYENDGPGYVNRMGEWKPRVKKAVFRWSTENFHYEGRRRYFTERKHKVEVPIMQLLNVDAYKPGDFKQFFADPRTRQEYLKWAPLMLAAEDYHAGKIALGEPSSNGRDW